MSPGRVRRPAPRRPHLDRELIVATAIELAATGAAITFRSLGTALGADPTAVYRHFRDKEELVRMVVDRLIQRCLDQIDADAAWKDQLQDGAERQMDIFAAHPSVGAEVSAIVTGGPAELAAIDWILSQFIRSGLSKADAVRYYAAYSSYLLAAAASLSMQRLRTGGDDTVSWVGDQRAVDALRYPHVAASLSELVALTDREVFVMGVGVLLDAAGAVGAAGAAGSARSTRQRRGSR